MKNLPLLLATLVISVLLIVGIAVIFSKPVVGDPGATVDTTTLTQGAILTEGPEDAPVTLVAFSDFQCPACKASEPMVQAVLRQYPDQVRLVFRNFPLEQLHRYARLAAQASVVAQEENQFAPYAAILFEKQETWSSLDSSDLVKTALSEYASELGIDSALFLERMESEDVANMVQNDINLGNSLKISATPTFFVNGIQTPAPELLNAVKTILDQQPL